MGKSKTPNKTQNSFPENISPEVAKIINDAPPAQKNLILSLLVKSHSGPLPDVETLRGYNEIIPNSAERLLKHMEIQREHRIELEKKALRSSLTQSNTGQYMAFFIALIFGAGAYDLIKSGHDIAGTILGSVDLVGLVSVFILGKRKQK